MGLADLKLVPMLSKLEIAELLSGVEIFLNLKPELLQAIAEVVEIRDYQAGDKIVQQGEDGTEFFVVVEGHVDVFVQDYALWTEQKVLELGPGKSFGETSLLTDERRSATVTASVSTKCVVLSKENFGKLMSRLAEVGVAVSRYLARRLSQQCKLTGHRFLSIDELVYDPKLYRAIPEPILQRCQAIPIALNGRTLTLALTRPNDLEVLRTLGAEVPGFGIEPMACSVDDYLAFLYRHRGGAPQVEPKSLSDVSDVRLEDGQVPAEPIRRILLSMLSSGTSHSLVDVEIRSAQVWSKKNHSLQPLLPACDAAQARSLRNYIDELLCLGERTAGVSHQAVQVQGRRYQLSLSALKSAHRARYSIELTDVKTAVPPLRSILPSEGTFNLIRAAAHQQGSILFWCGAENSGLSTSLYSVLESLADCLDLRDVVLMEDRPLIPHERLVQFPKPETLTSMLRVLVEQRPEVVGLDALNGRQLKELMSFAQLEPTVVATFAGDDLLEILLGSYREDRGSLSSWHRISFVVRQRLARKICHACCEQMKPKSELLENLKKQGLSNSEGLYFQGKGCPQCHHSGLSGVVPILEAVAWNRTLLEHFEQLEPGGSVWAGLPEELYAFSSRGFARLLLSKGMLEPQEALRVVGRL